VTSGLRMVWAAAFDRKLAEGVDTEHAVRHARGVVDQLLEVDRRKLDHAARAMLDDMLGTGADRVPR
jgi:hypothetical protein